jgi:ABC-type Mn2+/Zn2+ transport system permease subunit
MMNLLTLPILFLMLSAVPLAVSGYVVSAKRMGFYVDGVAHSSLAVFSILMVLVVIGLGGSTQLGVWLSVLVMGVIGATLSLKLIRRSESGEPWMGEVFILSLAIAAIVLSKYSLAGINLSQLFLGQFLLVEWTDIQILLAFNLLFIGLSAKFGRQWRLFFWDPSLYRHVFGVSKVPLWTFFFLVTALIGFLVQAVGLIFAFALLIIPGQLASHFWKSFQFRMGGIGGIVIGGGFLGLALSMLLDWPAGPTCALTLVTVNLLFEITSRRIHFS